MAAKAIILMLVLLMVSHSAVYPAKPLSSLQTEPSENLKELFPEEYGMDDDYFAE